MSVSLACRRSRPQNRYSALRHFGIHALDHAAVALYDAG